MSNKEPGCQDAFLNHLREKGVQISIYLVNGVRLNGYLIEHDRFSLLLMQEGKLQLIYKSAISTVLPSLPVKLFDDVSTQA